MSRDMCEYSCQQGCQMTAQGGSGCQYTCEDLCEMECQISGQKTLLDNPEFQSWSTAASWSTSEAPVELIDKRRSAFREALKEGTKEAELVKQVETLTQRIAELEKRKPSVSRSTKAPRKIILEEE